MAAERFDKRSSGFIQRQIEDVNGLPVAFDALLTGTLTLYDDETYVPGASPAVGIINNRNEQDILGGAGSSPSEGDVTFNENGFRWDLQPEDNIIVDPRRQVERHMAVFHFTWQGGAFYRGIEIEVLNLPSVP